MSETVIHPEFSTIFDTCLSIDNVMNLTNQNEKLSCLNSKHILTLEDWKY